MLYNFFRHDDLVTTPEGDDDEFEEISHISGVRIKSLTSRRGKYLIFMTHFIGNGLPHVRHRLSKVHRKTALQDFQETAQWHTFAETRACNEFMHAHPTRIHEFQFKCLRKGAQTTEVT
jgi:hypothetical protein